ncbi:hypothetical protein Z043_119518, partial [Scleropages formosus]
YCPGEQPRSPFLFTLHSCKVQNKTRLCHLPKFSKDSAVAGKVKIHINNKLDWPLYMKGGLATTVIYYIVVIWRKISAGDTCRLKKACEESRFCHGSLPDSIQAVADKEMMRRKLLSIMDNSSQPSHPH